MDSYRPDSIPLGDTGTGHSTTSDVKVLEQVMEASFFHVEPEGNPCDVVESSNERRSPPPSTITFTW